VTRRYDYINRHRETVQGGGKWQMKKEEGPSRGEKLFRALLLKYYARKQGWTKGPEKNELDPSAEKKRTRESQSCSDRRIKISTSLGHSSREELS